MKFEDVLPALRAGKEVLFGSIAYRFDTARHCFVDGSGKYTSFSGGELMSDRWYLPPIPEQVEHDKHVKWLEDFLRFVPISAYEKGVLIARAKEMRPS